MLSHSFPFDLKIAKYEYDVRGGGGSRLGRRTQGWLWPFPRPGTTPLAACQRLAVPSAWANCRKPNKVCSLRTM